MLVSLKHELILAFGLSGKKEILTVALHYNVG